MGRWVDGWMGRVGHPNSPGLVQRAWLCDPRCGVVDQPGQPLGPQCTATEMGHDGGEILFCGLRPGPNLVGDRLSLGEA
jgi:hypothetical protein